MSTHSPNSPEDQGGRRQRTKRLGDQLRRIYDSVASEGAPDDFLQLLDQADQKRGAGGSGAGTSGRRDDPPGEE